mmetsp:Transcript_11836/g.34204  ORF Transcript_11836/g.34204 Transcript_11836/m.34204 type:complete len:87 (-) Transcript_11836:334-594(-)
MRQSQEGRMQRGRVVVAKEWQGVTQEEEEEEEGGEALLAKKTEAVLILEPLPPPKGLAAQPPVLPLDCGGFLAAMGVGAAVGLRFP